MKQYPSCRTVIKFYLDLPTSKKLVTLWVNCINHMGYDWGDFIGHKTLKFLQDFYGLFPQGGNSHMKGAGMLIGNIELKP